MVVKRGGERKRGVEVLVVVGERGSERKSGGGGGGVRERKTE